VPEILPLDQEARGERAREEEAGGRRLEVGEGERDEGRRETCTGSSVDNKNRDLDLSFAFGRWRLTDI
jgi:hypothetical protein